MCASLLLACSDNKKNNPLPPRFDVSLYFHSVNTIGHSLPLGIDVNGCSKVSHAQVLYAGENEQHLLDVHFPSSPPFSASATLETEHFNPFFPQHGIAIHLSLKARVTCEDGRVSDSLPQSLSFLPVASTVKREDGMAATDSFIALGGAHGIPTTFLGCSLDEKTGLSSLLHFDTQGNHVGEPLLLRDSRLLCEAHTQISTLHNGFRWAYRLGEAGSLFAFSLHNNMFAAGAARFFEADTLHQVAVDSNGNAFTVSGSLRYFLSRYSIGNQENFSEIFSPSTTLRTVAFPVPPLVLESPYSSAQGLVLLPVWTVPANSNKGNFVIASFIINNNGTLTPQCGTLQTGVSPEPCPSTPPIEFSRDKEDKPMAPAALSKDGSRLYLALLNNNTSTVAVYRLQQSTRIGNATLDPRPRYVYEPSLEALPQANRFESPVTKLSLSRDERFLVASTDRSTRFLHRTQDGETLPTLGEKPLMVSGNLYVTEHIHGPNGSLVILNSPFFPNNPDSLLAGMLFKEVFGWPTEAIAIDSPENGELWRFSHGGSGDHPQNALTVAIDEGGQMWMRRGVELIKLLPQTTYRNLRAH
ncbi:MAG: hypothetical protein FWB81_08745 [Cystobacterineae bacterium]|nr:hypothetical protein [Cystobacterineae bacterium]